MNQNDIKEVDLNRSQALVQLINANVTYCPWPRASGKTSGGIGPRVLRLSEVMPRSQTLLLADTYERIEKVLWPGIESFLNEELGLLPDIDYMVHKKPPDTWTRPLYKPAKYDHVISFATGYTLCEVSMDVSGSGNGFNAQAVIADEVKYFDEKKFKSEVRPAIRGGRKYWGDLPEFQSMWFFTDKFPSKGANVGWILNKKAEVNQKHVDIIYTYQLYVLQLQELLDKTKSDSKIYKIKKQIEHFEKRMNLLRKDLVYYSDALPYENLEVLGEKYFRDLKRDMTTFEYNIAIENKDPDLAEKPFYPDLNANHFYKSTSDYNPNKPLIIALDYQFSISPLCVAQCDSLEGSPYSTLNFIQSFHALFPHGITAVVKEFCEYYKDYPDKHVIYIYDQTAIGRSPHGKSFKDLVIENLEANGWTVSEVYTGDPPDHDIKHERFKFWLNHSGDLAIRINELRNEYLKKSLEKASAVTVKGKTKKDKSSERENSRVPPEEATHYPDTFDQIVWAVCELQVVSLSDSPGLEITSGK